MAEVSCHLFLLWVSSKPKVDDQMQHLWRQIYSRKGGGELIY